MAITIINEQIYENGVAIDTPLTENSSLLYVQGGLTYTGTRYVVMYTCHTDHSLNQLSFTVRLAGTYGTGEGKYLGMYVTTSTNDAHLTTSIGGETFLRFGYSCTNRSDFTYNSDAPNSAVGVVKKIIPAGTFYVYIVPGVSEMTTFSTWYSKSSETYAATFVGLETDGNEILESHLVFVDDNETVFYSDGVSGATKGVGNNLMTITAGQQKIITRVVRHQFVAPKSGANKVSVRFYFTGMYNASNPIYYVPLRFYIGRDPDDHANANSTYIYTGELTMLDDCATLVGEADVVLSPNTTYYVWVFPAADEKYSIYQWVSNADSYLELFGASGVIYIDNGTSFDAYQFYIDNGTSWDLYIPYIDNGTSWDIYS